jgi:uncharacterized tellurite resistance protein B-like protein
MFDNLKSLFTNSAPQAVPPIIIDAPTALAALLVRAAKVDNRYAYEEIRMIDHQLVRRFGLPIVQAMKLRARAERLEATQAETSDLVEVIRDALPDEDRLEILEALWAVALVDGKQRANKVQLVQLASIHLGMPRADMQVARENAMMNS